MLTARVEYPHPSCTCAVDIAICINTHPIRRATLGDIHVVKQATIFQAPIFPNIKHPDVTARGGIVYVQPFSVR